MEERQYAATGLAYMASRTSPYSETASTFAGVSMKLMHLSPMTTLSNPVPFPLVLLYRALFDCLVKKFAEVVCPMVNSYNFVIG
ncbi:MAG: hypothetical protein ACI358_07495 [Candidatus Limimorpha sp.]